MLKHRLQIPSPDPGRHKMHKYFIQVRIGLPMMWQSRQFRCGRQPGSWSNLPDKRNPADSGPIWFWHMLESWILYHILWSLRELLSQFMSCQISMISPISAHACYVLAFRWSRMKIGATWWCRYHEYHWRLTGRVKQGVPWPSQSCDRICLECLSDLTTASPLTINN